MATYYVWSGATGTNAGTSWTNAYLLFASAVTAATANGDVILVHYTHQEELGGTATYTFAANVNVFSVNKDSSDAPTAMGTGGWLGNSTTNRAVTFNGAFKVYVYGITVRSNPTASAANLTFGSSDGSHFEFESCYFWLSGNNGSSGLLFGSVDSNSYLQLTNTTFRFGGTSQEISTRSVRLDMYGCSVSNAGSAPTTLFNDGVSGNAPHEAKLLGCDFSHITGTLFGSYNLSPTVFHLIHCKLGANVTILATQSPANKSSGAVYLYDCSSGDTHGLFAYYDAFGSCVSDTGIYYTTGAATQSWKIVTTANCSFYTPFVSPFVDFYNTGTSSITPYFEILRDGSTTAFQNDEIWGEFFVKTTSGSTQSTESSDRMALLGTPANQAAGAGTGSWTGEAASAWSGKVDSGGAVTPAEGGHIRGRVVVGEPSITVYADPQIRT